MQPKIAIIGAGLSGLSLAHHLKKHNSITVFEKSRGVGGRMSTRYTEDKFQFDHAAQYFTARSSKFRGFLKPFIEGGVVKEWFPKIVTLEKGKRPYKRLWYEPHYLAAPKMNALCKALAKELRIVCNTHIIKLYQRNRKWYTVDQNLCEQGPFDWVFSTAPAPQTSELFPKTFGGFKEISNIYMTGCFCLMLGLGNPLPLTWDAAKVNNSTLAWIAVDSSKPGRNSQYSIVLQTTSTWAEEFLEEGHELVSRTLIREFEDLCGMGVGKISYKALHRWRYAKKQKYEGSDDEPAGFFIDSSLRLGTCADWCLQGNVESAFLSATLLANAYNKIIVV